MVKAFGPGRRVSHAQAVQAALTNLAQVAGYADVAHLEWEMEVQTVQDAALSGRLWQVDAYTLQVVLEGVDASIQVMRGGRVLKTVPQPVRVSKAYQEARNAVVLLREHISRIRKGLLERLLTSGDTLALKNLTRLLQLPTVHTLLERLILRREDGQMGLFEGATCSLRALDGTLHLITGPVGIAHSYHLFQAGTLAEWQREIVHRRIVQPVKQAFRELYLLTPAEQETRVYSNRFVGHVVNGAKVVRLLTERNWRVQRKYDAYGYKFFSGIKAVFEFSHCGHYLGDEQAHTGSVYFETYSKTKYGPQATPYRRLSLDEVPALIFSEVMRDADLIASVAHLGDAVYISNEMYTRTGELVIALLNDLNLQGVCIDGHFAYVEGRLARYRVHLASAAIHIESGNYLCIVPVGWGQTHTNLFLPFVDNDNAKISEIISKILLLLADDRIKDESILRQIRGSR